MKSFQWAVLFAGLLLIGLSGVKAEEDPTEDLEPDTADDDLGASREGSRTDDEVVQREEERISLDGLSVAEMKELREKSEKHEFQAEVNRMMKLIINSLYRNKEIFLRELISNASDALDKIRLMSLTDKSVLDATPDLNIRIRGDKENHLLTITDTGIGMTKTELMTNLGTIAKSGTADFLGKMQEATSAEQMNDMIGQFGVGFYSSFLVADKVIVTTKHNDDKQYIWESDASSYSIVEDPRGDTLKRGTAVTLVLKEEAYDYLEHDTIKDLIKKYSQFINFNIYYWAKHTETVDEPIEEEEEEKKDEEAADDGEETEKKEEETEKEDEAEKPKDEDEDAAVEEDKEEEEEKPKTKKVTKTVWDWELINDTKPIWTRKPSEIDKEEYNEFYKSITKDKEDPLMQTHFIAEGEVTFKALLYVPNVQPVDTFQNYGKLTDNIKLYVRRVFITDEFKDLMPQYLAFIRGVVDSDDLPLNVSRETLQQHKLLKVIKKKLVRKALDMVKKLDGEDFDKFWKEYSTNIKLGVIDDSQNRSRLAKILRFTSSNGDLTSLAGYVERMKDGQDQIFYMAGGNEKEVKESPFVERLLKRGYEVLYLTEAVDEYAISALPEFEGKKFQNVAKEGFNLDGDTEAVKKRREDLKERFDPLLKWLSETALKDQILKAEVSERLEASPCALVASKYGWTANMQRIVTSQTHAKADDTQRDYYIKQKKALEINPRHPLIKELLRRVEDDAEDATAKEMAMMMFNTATLRSGYFLMDTVAHAEHIEKMMRQTLGIDENEAVEEEEDLPEVDEGDEEEVEEEEEEEEEETTKDEL